MPFIFGRFSEQSRRAEHGLLYLHGDWFTSLVSYRPNTYQPYTVDDRSFANTRRHQLHDRGQGGPKYT